MSGIRIEDISHVRFSAPDLNEMSAFLSDFGMHSALEADGVLYGRGSGAYPFAHITEPGEPAFLAVGFRARSVDDLERLAASEGTNIEPLGAPGGGLVTRLTDPDGLCVEVVAGQRTVPAEEYFASARHNDAGRKNRVRERLRLGAGPANVVRLGHAVLEVRDFRVSESWYKERFGFITSDEIEMAPGFSIGAFLRCDRGETPTDHHTLFLLQAPTAPRLNHAAFEVRDYDDLMCGHNHLKAAGRVASWGVGRHILGSQIFDYWKDPWGNELEHWTDGDLFAAEDGSHKASLHDLLGVQWGQPHPSMMGS